MSLRVIKRAMWMTAAVLGAAVSALSVAVAHHSFAMFDFKNTQTMTGTVEEFRWTNPHVVLLVVATPKPGEEPNAWSFELTSPGNLSRLGWTRLSLKPGDRIKVDYNPLRNGEHGGAFKTATLPDTGQVLTSSINAANEQPVAK